MLHLKLVIWEIKLCVNKITIFRGVLVVQFFFIMVLMSHYVAI